MKSNAHWHANELIAVGSTCSVAQLMTLLRMGLAL